MSTNGNELNKCQAASGGSATVCVHLQQALSWCHLRSFVYSVCALQADMKWKYQMQNPLHVSKAQNNEKETGFAGALL